MSDAARNWAGNYIYSTSNVRYPETTDELAAIVRSSRKLRVLGTRHSFNGIADSSDTLVSLARFAPDVEIDRGRRQATISANVTYGDLCPILHRAGYGLHNLASLPHISVVGACMTATHGSGVGNRSLAAAVAGLRFVTADGEVVSITRESDPALFDGAVVSLGGLGTVVDVTLDLLPAFDMNQRVVLNLPIGQMESHFDEIMSGAYSVSLFTDWRHDFVSQVWLKVRADDQKPAELADQFYGAVPAERQMHPIGELSAEACTQQLGNVGAWYDRLPHFRIDATPSAGSELQSEYFIPRRHAVDALRAVRGQSDRISPLLLVSEVRCIAADEFWMSPFYHQDSVGIHFTWKPDWKAVRQVLPRIEAALARYGARPHWGKLFTLPAATLRPMYGALPRFRDLLGRFDPQRKFSNAFLDAYVYGS